MLTDLLIDILANVVIIVVDVEPTFCNLFRKANILKLSLVSRR